jgi:redox-sensitive bicupin YhaK (pirin superfamily)
MLEFSIDQRRRNLGDLEVGRVLPAAGHKMVGPFIFFDHIGPVDLARGLSRTADVRPHPHIGLSTVTYLFDGEIMHRDSVGREEAIRPGEVNWMVAGRGITHSERFERARAVGDHLHGIQTWVALPDGQEEVEPEFAHYDCPLLPSLQEGGLWLRLIAGRAFGLVSPVKTHSELFYAHAQLAAGARLALPPQHVERAAYVVSGAVVAGGQQHPAGRLLAFRRGSAAEITAELPSVLMLLGGEPIGPRFIDWNFVASSPERIQQAKADWRAGRMKLPDLDNAEFIPLPEDQPAAR